MDRHEPNSHIDALWERWELAKIVWEDALYRRRVMDVHASGDGDQSRKDIRQADECLGEAFVKLQRLRELIDAH